MIIHRVVHGGNTKKPLIINKKTKEIIKKFSRFAPLHNPKELMIINLAENFKKIQYVVFDTIFFTKLPKTSFIYPIPKKISEKYQIKRERIEDKEKPCAFHKEYSMYLIGILHFLDYRDLNWISNFPLR